MKWQRMLMSMATRQVKLGRPDLVWLVPFVAVGIARGALTSWRGCRSWCFCSVLLCWRWVARRACCASIGADCTARNWLETQLARSPLPSHHHLLCFRSGFRLRILASLLLDNLNWSEFVSCAAVGWFYSDILCPVCWEIIFGLNIFFSNK